MLISDFLHKNINLTIKNINMLLNKKTYLTSNIIYGKVIIRHTGKKQMFSLATKYFSEFTKKSQEILTKHFTKSLKYFLEQQKKKILS